MQTVTGVLGWASCKTPAMGSDLEIGLSAFVGVMVAEVIIKPIAVRLGQAIVRKVDSRVGWIPDWLHNQSE